MIPPEQDAFGHQVYDYYQGQAVTEIVERDDGYIAPSLGPAVYFAPFTEWFPHQQALMDDVRGRTLDVGCGPGRVCLHLQEQGIEVVGIDNSPLAVKTAQLRGVKDARVLSITQVSRKAVGLFDTIVMMGNNFGLFGSPERAKWLLRRFHGLTSERGRILAESRNVYRTDNPDHLAFHERNRQRGRLAGQLRLRIRYKAIKGPWFDYLTVAPEEMAAILEGTGWHIARLHEGGGELYAAVIEKGEPE